MVMYIHRYLIGSTMTTCSAVVMNFLGKYMTMCLILSFAEGAMHM